MQDLDSQFLKKDYYQILISNIENFINKKDYQKAQLIISEELAMPYIPFKIEQKLLFYQNEIFSKMGLDNSKFQMNFENLLSIFLNNNFTVFEKIDISENFMEFNLKNKISEFSDFFLNSSIPDLIKLKIISIFKRQNIDCTIDVFLKGKINTLNLKEFDNFLNNKNFINDSHKIEEQLFKNPVIKNFSLSILEIIYISKINNFKYESDYLIAIFIAAILLKEENVKEDIKNKINNYYDFVLKATNFIKNLNFI